MRSFDKIVRVNSGKECEGYKGFHGIMEFIMIIHTDGNFASPHIGLNYATSDFCVTPLNMQIQF